MTQVWVYLGTLYFLLLLQRFPLRGPYQEQLLSHSVILSWLSRSHGELALYRAQSLLSQVLIHFKKILKVRKSQKQSFLALTLKHAGGGLNQPIGIRIWLVFLQFSSKLLNFFLVKAVWFKLSLEGADIACIPSFFIKTSQFFFDESCMV